MNLVVSSDWADAKLAERQAFNRVSEARSQADWLKAWTTWTSTIHILRQKAKHPGFERVPALEPESEVELQFE